MAINLLDMFKDVVGDQLARQASGFLGESTSSTNSAISVILPAIVGGLVNKGESQGGTASILDYLKNENVDGSILDKLAGMFGGGDATNEVLQKGSGALDFIFGKDSSTIGKILDFVTNSSNIGRGSSSSLLKMAAPILIGILGRTVKDQGLDATGLSSLLASQKEYVKNAAPNGLLGKLSLAAFGDQATSNTEDDEVPDTSSGSKSQIGPWIFLIGIALTMLYLMKSCGGREPAGEVVDQSEEVLGSSDGKTKDNQETAEHMTKRAEEAAKDVVEQVKDTAAEAKANIAAGLTSIKLPGGAEITAKTGSFVDNVYNYLNGGTGDEKTRFTFDNLTFQSSSANLAESSSEQLNDIANILSAFPTSLIRIEGHTDNTGDPAKNQLLSEQRALAVKRALNGLGVDNVRMETKGFGQENPITSNGTEAGRRKNRRVDIYITKK